MAANYKNLIISVLNPFLKDMNKVDVIAQRNDNEINLTITLSKRDYNEIKYNHKFIRSILEVIKIATNKEKLKASINIHGV